MRTNSDREPKLRDKQYNDGFSLVELLAVISIMAILLAYSAPSMLSAINGARLSQAGEEIQGFLSEAQERSAALGRPVEVRLYRIPSNDGDPNEPTDGYFRGLLMLEYYQAGEPDPRGGTSPALVTALAVANRPMMVMPSGIVASEDTNLSTLTTDGSLQGAAATSVPTIVKTPTGYEDFEFKDTANYASFVIFPDGTNLSTGAGSKWFITMLEANSFTTPAPELKNFYTIQIDPTTARVTAFRP
jgi:uncharacterized protein (TIGR02596 family)